jgi:separase
VGRSCGAAILNPTADLTATQEFFEQPLQRLRDWEIIVQREPSEEEMKSCLETHDVFLYFGHGSGAQYIRSRTIKKLDKCAITLLMGCSSGVLSEAGEFEPYGTPINYMQAGCPALVANLWDVTDKDIDKFSFGVLKTWGLFQDEPLARSPVKGSTRPTRGRNKTAAAAAADVPTVEREVPVSLDQAVAKSRDLCKLRYLNGAAPVVYGVPVFLA